MAAALAVAAPGAGATPAALVWSSPQVLDGSLQARQPRVQLTDSGELIAAWTDRGEVLGARPEPGGQTLPQTLWRGSPAAQARLLLSATPDGHALVAWVAGGRLRAAYREPGRAFTPVTVQGGNRVSNPAAAIDDHGDAVLVWQKRVGRLALTPVLLARCSSRRCSSPHMVTARGLQPHIGIDRTGTATVAWTSGDRERQIATVEVPAHGPKRHSQVLRAGGGVAGVHLQEAPNGAAVLSWGAESSDRSGQASYRVTGRRFSAPLRLTGHLVGFAPILTAPVAGRWWTTFQGFPLTPLAEYVGQRQLVKDATAHLDLTDPIDTAALAGDRAGDAAVIWETDTSLQATFVDSSANVTPLSQVGPSGGFDPSVLAFPQAAIGDGRIAVAWLERPPYDPLDMTKAMSGRVVVSTASLNGTPPSSPPAGG